MFGHAQRVAGIDLFPGDPSSVDLGPIAALEIFEPDAVGHETQDRVPPRNVAAGQDDLVGLVGADRIDARLDVEVRLEPRAGFAAARFDWLVGSI
jgi:hypothetical protein